MRVEINLSGKRYAGPWGFVAQIVVMTLASLLAAWILPGVRFDSVVAAIIASVVLALLNNFVRPILIALTLPFTIISMGLFLLVLNALLILFTSALVRQFHVDGFFAAFFYSLLLTFINYLLELPNRRMRKPQFESENSNRQRLEEEVQDCEEVNDED